jgi:putative glutamine amidotransferase
MSQHRQTDSTPVELNQRTCPRIGITMRLELESERFYLSRHYSGAVEAAGGAPVHISLIPQRRYISTILEGLDGILLPGSDSDVDPLRYGAEPHPKLGSVHAIKDETDLLVLEEVEKRALPLFAICFGVQVLNVSRGGTLIQDIPSQIPKALKHEQGAPRDRPSHSIELEKSSLLYALRGEARALVNSHHHQAIEKVGRDLVATAWAGDGLIEALEDTRPDRFAVGVQWHPELGWKEDGLSQALFDRFIEAARLYAGRAGEREAQPLKGLESAAKQAGVDQPRREFA